MVDVDVRGGGPGGTVVRGEPGSGRGSAGAVGHHVAAVALEDILAGKGSVYAFEQNRGKRLYRVLQAPLTVPQVGNRSRL